jgi:hypothetical protein
MVIQTLDTGIKDYWKVPVDLLCKLSIVEYISNFSFLGSGKDILNQKGYAYLEIDADVLVFVKAMKYNDLDFTYDHNVLQKAYKFTYNDYDRWSSKLSAFDVELLKDYSWSEIPTQLLNAINYKDDDFEGIAMKDCEF